MIRQRETQLLQVLQDSPGQVEQLGSNVTFAKGSKTVESTRRDKNSVLVTLLFKGGSSEETDGYVNRENRFNFTLQINSGSREETMRVLDVILGRLDKANTPWDAGEEDWIDGSQSYSISLDI